MMADFTDPSNKVQVGTDYRYKHYDYQKSSKASVQIPIPYLNFNPIADL
jgi:hypothetical protein